MPSSELSELFCYVYLLYSPDSNTFYVGFTHNIERRLAEHNKGLNFSTKFAAPWSLIYYEAHTDEGDAMRREKYLKTSAGKQAINKMLREKLAKDKNLSHQKVYY